MKKTDMVKLLVIINTAFPNMKISESTVTLWHELLGDLEYVVAEMAVKKMLLESPYMPTIADIRKQAVSIMTPKRDQLDGAQAWGEVLDAIHQYGYYRQEEALGSMSPIVARVVKYMGWQEICTSEEPGVIRGQFLKMYQQLQNREREDALIPEKLQEDIQRMSENHEFKETKTLKSKVVYLPDIQELKPNPNIKFEKGNLKALFKRDDEKGAKITV